MNRSLTVSFAGKKKNPDCNYLMFWIHNCGNDNICFYKFESNDGNFHFHVISLSNVKVHIRKLLLQC